MIELKKGKLKLYSIFYSKIFGCIYENMGKKSYIINPILVTGKKYININDNVCIWDNGRIECIDKWNNKKFSPQLIIKDGCCIGQGLHLTCAEKIVIEKDVTIVSDVLITDITHSYEKINVHQLQNEIITKPVTIGEYSFIGAGVKILPGAQIGKNCIIGANAVVVSIIPDYSIAVGIPAKIIKKYNFDKQKWESIKE